MEDMKIQNQSLRKENDFLANRSKEYDSDILQKERQIQELREKLSQEIVSRIQLRQELSDNFSLPSNASQLSRRKVSDVGIQTESDTMQNLRMQNKNLLKQNENLLKENRSLHLNNSFSNHASMIAHCFDSFKNKTIVIKTGTMIDESFYEDITTLQKLNFRLVLVAPSNEEAKIIANGICNAAGNALQDKNGNILKCVRIGDGVGRVERVDTTTLDALWQFGCALVLSSVVMIDFVEYDCGHDAVTSKVASELKASQVLFLNQCCIFDRDMNPLKDLSPKNVEELIQDQTITGEMITMASYAVDAIKKGVEAALITDGRVPHIVLEEILGGSKHGTIIRSDTN